MSTVAQRLNDPYKLYETVDGPHKRKHWLVSLPAALRQLVSHLQDLDCDLYAPELKGALTTKKYEPIDFHAAERVRRRFFDEFQESYKGLAPPRSKFPPCLLQLQLRVRSAGTTLPQRKKAKRRIPSKRSEKKWKHIAGASWTPDWFY